MAFNADTGNAKVTRADHAVVRSIVETPESLASGTAVPAWAAGADCVGRRNDGIEVWELRRDGETIGWMYDEGSGYEFAKGAHNQPDDLLA